jgi:hypothetical protein
LSATLYSLYGYCGAALDEIGTNDPALSAQLTTLRQAIENFRKTMLAGDAQAQASTRKNYRISAGVFQRHPGFV